MMISFSKFGERFGARSGMRQLMDDLGEVLTSTRPMMNLGGGNPGSVPEVNALFRKRMQQLMDSGGFEEVVTK